jgi:hypothetical protein
VSARNEDENILQWLRRLQARVDELTKGAGTRQNDIRLDDWATTVNSDGCIVATNVKTGVQTIICPSSEGIHEVMWSYGGEVLAGALTDLGPGPTWYPYKAIQIVELIITFQQNTMSGDDLVVVTLLRQGSSIATCAIPGGYLKTRSYPGMSALDLGDWPIANDSCGPDQSLGIEFSVDGIEDPDSSLGMQLSVVLRYRFVGTEVGGNVLVSVG